MNTFQDTSSNRKKYTYNFFMIGATLFLGWLIYDIVMDNYEKDKKRSTGG